jgi:hypothetical protein
MEKEYYNHRHDDEMSISPNSEELLEKIIESDANELGAILGEIVATKMNISNGQPEISHVEAELLIQLIDLVRPRSF